MDLVVKRKDISKLLDVVSPSLTIGDGEILVKVEKFSLTSNIVSYGTAGESLGYFNFFPTNDNKETARIPVWGYSKVVVSRCTGINEGDRYYGYYPMSNFLVLKPGKIKDDSFVDIIEHRTKLPGVYNTYYNVTKADWYDNKLEDLIILLRPLCLTGYLLSVFLGYEKNFSAKNVLITSASSKTSLSLAFELSRHSEFNVIGLTSEKNIDFVKSTKFYSKVVSYSDVEKVLDKSDTYTIVDMRGNSDFLLSLDSHFSDKLKYICLVGNTDWKETKSKVKFKAKKAFFFAPSQGVRLVKDHGQEKVNEMMSTAFTDFVTSCSKNGIFKMVNVSGEPDIKAMFDKITQNKVAPNEAVICSLWRNSGL